jgi:hypothetical protein
MTKTSWTWADDIIVGTSYLHNGTTVTDELRAALPGHHAGSIRMRLQNFNYLDTNGASGLSRSRADTGSLGDDSEGTKVVNQTVAQPIPHDSGNT